MCSASLVRYPSPGNHVLRRAGNEADQAANPDAIQQENGIRFTCERWLGCNIPTPDCLDSPRPLRHTKLSLRLLTQEPGYETVKEQCLRQVMPRFRTTFTAVLAEPALRTGGS